MNEAIRIAIEKGGYEVNKVELEIPGTENDKVYLWQLFVLDPLFWQALGKAMLEREELKPTPFWKDMAHQYFDLVLTGGDLEKFWSDLLTLK